MANRTQMVADRVRFLALADPETTVLALGATQHELVHGTHVLRFRAQPDALPLGAGTIAAVTAAEVLRESAGLRHAEALGELLRVVRPGGCAVIAEDDAAGTVGAEHARAVAAGWVPSPMETIPGLLPPPVRLFVVFKPLVGKGPSSERGHDTH